MILLEKRAHLVLEISLAMVRLLPIDVPHQRAKIRRTDGKQTRIRVATRNTNACCFIQMEEPS